MNIVKSVGGSVHVIMVSSNDNNTSSSLLMELKKRWFLIAIVLVIISANIYPNLGAKYGKCIMNFKWILGASVELIRGCGINTLLIFLGPLRPEITIKYIAVSLIFFNSGLSLQTEVRYINLVDLLIWSFM